jgi:hypothetical protein
VSGADGQDEVDVRFITMVFGSLILAAATQGTSLCRSERYFMLTHTDIAVDGVLLRKDIDSIADIQAGRSPFSHPRTYHTPPPPRQ